MLEQIYKLFPELELIQDESLRTQTAEVWEMGINRGGWALEDLADIPFTLLLKENPVNLIEHTRAVTLCAYHSAKEATSLYGDRLQVNFDYLVSGGILHDVGKLLEFERKESDIVKSHNGKMLHHPFSGAALAYELEIPEEICHIIATHAKEGDMGHRTPEAYFVHHADFMNFHSLKAFGEQ